VELCHRAVRSQLLTAGIWVQSQDSPYGSSEQSGIWAGFSLPWGYSGGSMKLASHLHLVPRLRMHGTIPPDPRLETSLP